METTQAANEIDWINSHLQHHGLIDGQQVQSITNFSLLWNLFEGHVCEQNASIRTFENIVARAFAKGILTRKDFEKYLNYFQSRYVCDGQLNRLFYGLCFRRNDKQELVENVMLGKDNELTNVVLSLLIIVYRLRNNLFHGIKSLYDINNQVDNFRNANKILIKIIDLSKA